ncbi:MAG: NifU family protein [Pseudomonadota bacterium]
MFIQTETTADPATLRFVPGRPVLPLGSADFPDAVAAARSPLAQHLFEVDGVVGVVLDTDSIAVRKRAEADWRLIKPAIFGVIMEHFTSGKPILRQAPGAATAESGVRAKIEELLLARIAPTMAGEGGEVVLRGYAEGIVRLELRGARFLTPVFALKVRIENTFKKFIPEIEDVRFVEPARPRAEGADKPGLATPAGEAIQLLLDNVINPGVAAHGGHISLVDIEDDTAYIRLEGGCQGCGMADVTLKQGVETQIKEVAPNIATVLDVSDHAEGTNPYYQPGKGGASPFGE